MDQPIRLVAVVHWFDSKRPSWLQGPCCNVAKRKNGLRGPYALKIGFGLQRRHAVCGCLLCQVPFPGLCKSIPSSSRPEALGSVEYLVQSRNNVVLYSRSHSDGTRKLTSSRHQSKTAYNKHRRHSEIEFVTVRYLTFDSGELDYGAWK